MSVTTFIEDEHRWQAVLERRADADERFVFAVSLTDPQTSTAWRKKLPPPAVCWSRRRR